MVTKHFVTFYSPGTFVSEESTKPINKWDVDLAVSMSKDIKERYGALPYGFQFSTRSRGKMDLDSNEIKRSNMYYLGGTVETLADVEKRATKEDDTLLWNMRTNDIKKIITNNNSWKFTAMLNDGDVILQYVMD